MSEPLKALGEDDGESFISHLIELRTRLLRAAMAYVVALVCCLPFTSRIYDFLAAPMLRALPEGTRMIATGVISPFSAPLKVTAAVALVLALPMILYQLWAFVAPGLYTHEKRLAAPIIVSSFVLFLCGVAFTYFFVFGTVFHAIYKFAPHSVTVAPDIDSYLSFVLTMFLAFGVTFEVPIVVVVLVHFGLVSVAKLREWRPYMVVGAFGIAALVTPPDPGSMLLLAVPLWMLYEAGVVAAALFVKPRTGEAAAQPDAKP